MPAESVRARGCSTVPGERGVFEPKLKKPCGEGTLIDGGHRLARYAVSMEPLIYALAAIVTGIVPVIARSGAVQRLLHKLDDSDAVDAADRHSDTNSPASTS